MMKLTASYTREEGSNIGEFMKSMYRESFRVLLIGYMRETDVVGTYIFYIG